MEEKRKAYTLNEALRKMERYCAYQERCHSEVRNKLQHLGMINEAIDQIMVHLIRHDFLNEERFAINFAQGKFHHKKWGKNRIIRELEIRQISDYTIRTALNGLDNEEYDETLHELAMKRLGQIKEQHPLKRKRKLADYLLYRGWEPSKVYEKVHELVR